MESRGTDWTARSLAQSLPCENCDRRRSKHYFFPGAHQVKAQVGRVRIVARTLVRACVISSGRADFSPRHY